ncbi:hypothetical protein [Myxococcus landrumensis]|uniref:PDZ domain-containing protein n=1 Tax=Myxococcus landrumensis TaxID=2813577 RepID=A0ABX7N3V6_9BACT|nr:hypothetical protein [Myxococcus landrumus]QSQ12382.1 hypothetical protein JY572_29040 [Myxococcus landrumus]
MKPLSRKYVWRWGVALTLVATLAVGLYGSRMFHEAPSEPIREAAPSEPTREPPLEPIRDDPYKDTVVRQVGEHAYEITVGDSARTPQNVCTRPDVRIAFASKQGKPLGIQVSDIPPGSIYEKLGLQNEDILQYVNGHALDTPEKMLEAYAQVKDARRVEVDLLRGGVVLRKVYDLK